MIKQLPLSWEDAGKRDIRTQFAALCYRIKAEKVQVLLVTSRGTGRWIVPKGWPMEGKTPAEAVQLEAWEEAGVTGKALHGCIGVYSYEKMLEDANALPCLAMLYPVKVKALAKTYPEVSERRRKWVSRKKAARLVGEPELARMILDFDPRKTMPAG